MPGKKKEAPPKRLPEQERYIASFAEAMRAVERAQDERKQYGKAYKELKRMGAWDAEYLSHAYVLVVGKLSPLSSRLREYILMLGELARQIFEKHEENGKEGN